MKTTSYFISTRSRLDRAIIKDEWICWVIKNPERIELQSDGRVRYLARIPEANDKWLRVITLEDGVTVHNAFFDRQVRNQ